MAVIVEAQTDGGVVLHYSGVLTSQQIIQAKKSLATEEYRGMKYLLVDVDPDTDIDVSTEGVLAIVAENRQLARIASPNMPVAIAAPQDLCFGLARMWEVLAHETGWRTYVVRSRQEADAWIQEKLRNAA